MLEMFTDNDPMRLDDFKFPADIGHIAKGKRPCYNDGVVGDRPSPVKSVERMRQLTIEAIVNNMAPLTKGTDFWTYQPMPGQLMVVTNAIGHQHPVLSITVATESRRITVTYNTGIPPAMYSDENDLKHHAVKYELYVKI